MVQSITRRHRVTMLSALTAVALMLALAGIAHAQPTSAITISDLTPTNGSTITAGQSVVVSGFITTDNPIALVNNQPDVTVTIDGSQVTPQFVVGSGAVRVGFQTTQTFSAGSHTVQVTARNVNGETTQAQTTFTAAAGTTTATATTTTTAATTPAVTATTTVAGVTTTPQQLPSAGGMPVDLVLPLLLGLGAAAAGIGLRLRAS